MTIEELAALGEAETETPTVILTAGEAAAIAETYQDADEQRHAMAEQLADANAKYAAALGTLAAAQAALEASQAECAGLRHHNTLLIRQNAALRRESNTLISRFAKDLRDALGLEDAEDAEDADDDQADAYECYLNGEDEPAPEHADAGNEDGAGS